MIILTSDFGFAPCPAFKARYLFLDSLLGLQIIEKMKKAKKIVYVVGNHDEGLLGLVGKKVMGVEFVKRYEFEEEGRTFRIEHGDAYDKGVLHNRIFVKFLSVIQSAVES